MQKSGAAILAVFALTAVLAGAAVGQTTGGLDLPRTFEGRPDFSGAWTSRSLTMTERAEPGPLVVDDETAAKVAQGIYDFIRSDELAVDIDPDAIAADVGELLRVGGEWRTSYVTLPEDGKLPLTAEGARRIAATSAHSEPHQLAGPEGRDDFERCLTGSGETPLYQVPSSNARLVVQSADHVLIYTEEGGDLRKLRIGGAPLPEVLVTRYGDSIARWEGDVLVVETTNVEPHASGFPGGKIVVGEASRVVEHLQLLSADELLYRFTVEDDALYTEPWSAEFSMKRTGHKSYEYGCHEGNYSIVNILKAARIAEQ